MKQLCRPLLAAICYCACMSAAGAFVPAARWSNTATDGLTGDFGDAITVTWSIVPDGTSISGEAEPSDLVAFLDGIYGGPQGSIEERLWFPLFEQSFDRWSELGGINFVYEPADDGATHGTASGIANRRADVRIAGAPIDGDSGTLAYNAFPNSGDMVIDTSDSFYNFRTFNSRRLRNVLMHEAGHGFGLGHIVSNDAEFLLEPFIATSFDGPQYDDIRGIQHLYGDAFEQAHGGAGNNTAVHATSLGLVSDGGSVAVGTDTGFDTAVSAGETDFVSLANNNDVDFFSFSIDEPSQVDITLTPVGATFNQGSDSDDNVPFVTSSQSDLALTLYDSNGQSVLIVADNTGAGGRESILDYQLDEAGEYFVRITGDADTVQFYELGIAAQAVMIESPELDGDYNDDGLVNLADYTVWRDNLSQVGANHPADSNGNGVVDTGDYTVWQSEFGGGTPAGVNVANTNVPEPATVVLLLFAMVGVVGRRPFSPETGAR